MKVADVLMLSYGGGPRSGKYWIRRSFAEKWSPGQIQGAGTLARRPGSGNGPVCTSLNARSGPGAFHTLEWPRPARAANSGSCYISRENEPERQLCGRQQLGKCLAVGSGHRSSIPLHHAGQFGLYVPGWCFVPAEILDPLFGSTFSHTFGFCVTKKKLKTNTNESKEK